VFPDIYLLFICCQGGGVMLPAGQRQSAREATAANRLAVD